MQKVLSSVVDSNIKTIEEPYKQLDTDKFQINIDKSDFNIELNSNGTDNSYAGTGPPA